MGKCISKNSTSLTIALSDKDLARASHILSKFTESSEYIALKDEHRNQLCECFAVNDTCIQPQLGLGEKVSTISAASIGSEKAEKPTQKYYCHQQSHFYGGGGAQHLGEQEFGHPQQDTSQDNTCLHSVDHEMPTDSRLLPPKRTSYNGPNRGNDAFQSYDDYVAVVHALSVAPRTDNKYSYSKFNEPFVDDDRCEEVVDCSNFCDGKRRSNKYYAKDGTNYDQSVLANNNNNNEATQKNNYCTGVPQYLAQLLVQHQIKDLEAKAHETTEIIVECHLECDTKRANNKTMQRSQALIVANNNAQKKKLF